MKGTECCSGGRLGTVTWVCCDGGWHRPVAPVGAAITCYNYTMRRDKKAEYLQLHDEQPTVGIPFETCARSMFMDPRYETPASGVETLH